MHKKHNRKQFLDYLNTPMSKEGITILYDANNVRFERCELYSDFVQSLLHLSFDTYMGDDITNQLEQVNHFNWCWDKNISNFEKEGVKFDSIKLYEYFLEFMLEVYYSSTDKKTIKDTDKMLLKLWVNILDYDRVKTHVDMDSFIEIYRLFESSIV